VRRNGVSVVEILFVITVVGFLAWILVPIFLNAHRMADEMASLTPLIEDLPQPTVVTLDEALKQGGGTILIEKRGWEFWRDAPRVVYAFPLKQGLEEGLGAAEAAGIKICGISLRATISGRKNDRGQKYILVEMRKRQ
jgi:hypothetical protein